MTVPIFALIEGLLLLFGALLAARLTSRVARKVDRNVVLMAAVAIWFILVAMVPFLIFALLVGRVPEDAKGVDPLSSLVLNAIPFALVLAPLLGFTQGWKLSRSNTSA